MIDLRSDTVTKPTSGMRAAIAAAEVGDDMSGEDPTVNALEARMAELFGMEAAVYNCSGTQSNQMAVRAHCQSGDELLIEETSHIANYEAGGAAVLSGVTCRTLRGRNGLLEIADVEGKVRADNQHFCPTRLLCLENTTNQGGGRTYSLEQLARLHGWARQNQVLLHLDGARIFNACQARGYQPDEIGQLIDSISICFSKGLGCPMGSILLGKTDFVKRARRARKLFGGALRQAGMMAAAAIYAVDHHVTRLGDDHETARRLAEGLAQIPGVLLDPAQIETNLVFFEIDPAKGTASQLSTALKLRGVLMNPVGHAHRLRACTHLDVSVKDIDEAIRAVREVFAEGFQETVSQATGPYAAR